MSFSSAAETGMDSALYLSSRQSRRDSADALHVYIDGNSLISRLLSDMSSPIFNDACVIFVSAHIKFDVDKRVIQSRRPARLERIFN